MPGHTSSSSNAASLETLFNEISSYSLRERLKSALDAHTSTLIEKLGAEKSVRASLEDRLRDVSAQYNKAVREMRYFRERYQQQRQQLSMLFSDAKGNPSCTADRPPLRTSGFCQRGDGNDRSSCMSPAWEDTSASSSSAHSSPYSSKRSSTSSKPYFPCTPHPAEEQIDLVDIMAAVSENTHLLTVNTLVPVPPPDRPPPPPPPPARLSAPPTYNSGQQNQTHKYNEDIKRRNTTSKLTTKGLIYACGDGFWDTIARGKNRKSEVDILVSNYLRRGGQPNVAKNSPSLKSVKEGYGLLHALVAVKNTHAVGRVIEAGADPNAVALGPNEEDQTTPLVLAAALGYMRGVRFLLERANADIFKRGPQRVTALHAAVANGSMEVVVYLLRASRLALLESVDVNGATPLHYACMLGRIRILILFVRDCHAEPNPRDHKGETPLHYAVRRHQYKAVCKLVGDLGAYPNPYVPRQIPTPLDLARSGGFKAIAEYLRKMGAKTAKDMHKTVKRSFSAASSSSSSGGGGGHHTSTTNSSAISSIGPTSSSTFGTASVDTTSGFGNSDSSSMGSILGAPLRSFNL